MTASVRLLLVEDNASDQIAFEGVFRTLGYKCKIASTWDDARRLIDTGEFDIIVASCNSSTADPFAAFSSTTSAPIIFAIAQGAEEAVENALKAGAFDCLLKDSAGFYLRMLPLRIKAALAQRHREKHAAWEIQEAKSETDAINCAQSALTATVSHEIRTPLNGILGMSELLARTDLSITQREYLKSIRECGESLLLIVNDVLDLSKMESGKLTLEHTTFDLLNTIQSSVELPALAAEKKGVAVVLSIAPSVPAFVVGDPSRLRQILTNLIGNAIKFTDRGSVTIRVNRAKQGADVLAFEIKDTGIGISPETQATIFQPFVQAESSTSRRFGGTGLGLSICRQLVSLMEGEMGVESNPNAGSLFWFRIRLPETTPPADVPKAKRSAENNGSSAIPSMPQEELGSKLRILLVEDNELNQRVAVGMLNLLGQSATVVSDGAEALKAIRSGTYDIVFMDCEMPNLNGFAATRAIRELQTEQPEVASLPIVALTAQIAEGTLAKCLAHGMNGYISKPFNLTTLRTALEEFAGASLRVATPDVPKEPALPPAEDPSELTVLDHSKLDDLRMLDGPGGTNVLATLLRIFFREAPPLFQDLQTAIDDGDLEKTRGFAHKLSGSCSNFGGVETTYLCRKIERCAERRDIVTARSVKPLLESAFHALSAALQHELTSISST